MVENLPAAGNLQALNSRVLHLEIRVKLLRQQPWEATAPAGNIGIHAKTTHRSSCNGVAFNDSYRIVGHSSPIAKGLRVNWTEPGECDRHVRQFRRRVGGSSFCTGREPHRTSALVNHFDHVT